MTMGKSQSLANGLFLDMDECLQALDKGEEEEARAMQKHSS